MGGEAMSGIWTDEVTQKAVAFWRQGRSGLWIARELKISRNAVLGKMFRLGEQRSPEILAGLARVKRTTARAPKPVAGKADPVVIARINPPPVKIIADDDLIGVSLWKAKGCSWPIGPDVGSDMLVCDHERQPGSPYCERHHARAYVKRKVA